MQELSISTLVRYLKNKIDGDLNLQNITVTGEISNYHRHYSGHLYFTLKDEHAAINCVMFKSAAFSLSFEPKNGDKIVCTCNTSIFETSGQLQLYVKKMNLYGLGDLYARYEKLKKELSENGYFDEDHKINIRTEYPERVAVLVGDNSAAMSDIKRQFARRWPLCKTDYYPVLVQGNDAPTSIIDKLKTVDDMDYDAIILARGGGSFEDLFCFNDESLVKTIYALRTFIISGVGHEQDFTLTDFVCDLRAPTPTAAVEMITPDIQDIYQNILDNQGYLNNLITNKTKSASNRLDYYFEKLARYNSHIINRITLIDGIERSLKDKCVHKISLQNSIIEQYIQKMYFKTDSKLNSAQLTYKRLNTLLEAYATDNVLKRGYTIVLQDNKVVKKASELKDKEFSVRFVDDEIKAIRKD
ncbi:MAG: exodeoxyribonuclease VII large subunit [Erysipelotrichaceae bacterium]|nr:exodeoxyribonuclease VII large subunit [Erysipelotrichaceae bacterium]